ncbi:MAG: tail fiber domain-containing protein, partial [Gammaproteobacteria bacterium]|nr:tail fiber domain-containing protein [Gammaproteobacteria bacterium]
DTDFESQRPNQFRVEATGGARFEVGDDLGSLNPQWVDLRTMGPGTFGGDVAKYRVIDTSTGAYLSVGGTWVNSSDVNRKTGFAEVDVNDILERVAAMPMQTWRYKVEGEEIRHIGPMAQDFQASFGFGGDPKGISSLDADGVALAAIQALYQLTNELERRTTQLETQQRRIETLEAQFMDLSKRLAPLQIDRLTVSLMPAKSQ